MGRSGVIFPDRKEAKRVMDGKVTAVIRPASAAEPYVQLAQQVQWRRLATNEDVARLRERQAAKPDDLVALGSLGWIEVSEQELVRLRDLTADDARALGVGSVLALRSWVRQHMAPWEENRRVWVVRFDVVRLVEEVPQFLGRPGPAGDYTTDRERAVDDLECVDGPTQMRLGDAARKADALRAARKFEEWQLGERLEALEEQARAAGIDLSQHRRVIADRIARIERLLRDRAA